MQECQPAALQYTGREFFVHRGRRFQGEFLRLLDDWINDVPLAPLLQLAVQERHHLVVRRSVAQQRRHRLPAGRTFVEHADIEVSVQREGQRSWDGRRTHEQRVRAFPLFTECRAVLDAEAVLFVDDRETQLPELCLFLYQRVCPDGKERVTGGEAVVRRATLGGTETSRHQQRRNPQWREQPA